MKTLTLKITVQELENMFKSKEAYCSTMNRLYREAGLPYFFYIDENGMLQTGIGRYYE